jgi:hypothetical protein
MNKKISAWIFALSISYGALAQKEVTRETYSEPKLLTGIVTDKLYDSLATSKDKHVVEIHVDINGEMYNFKNYNDSLYSEVNTGSLVDIIATEIYDSTFVKNKFVRRELKDLGLIYLMYHNPKEDDYKHYSKYYMFMNKRD